MNDIISNDDFFTNDDFYGKEICFQKQKMIDGEYDLKKLLGIDFLNKESIPDRGFLKGVTFTKNIYLALTRFFNPFTEYKKE